MENGSQYMIIKVDTESGRVVDPPEDEKGRRAEEVPCEVIDKIYRSDTGFKYVATILHAHSSPGCIYLQIGGNAYKICR